METLEERKARREAARKSVEKVASDTLAALQSMIEAGTAPWCRPWSLAGNISFATGESYSARNQFCIHLQQMEAEKEHGYTPGPADEYCTWQQLKKEGLLDKLKGHHGAACLAPTIKTFLKATGKFDEDGEEIMEERQFKGYKGIVLFNRQELGLPKLHPGPVAHEHDKVEEAERIIADYIARTGIKLELTASGDEAYNTHDCQRVQVPRMNRFASVEEYYSTLFHELTHSTAGHGCPRKCHENYHKKTDERAQEEMIAELGAATLCALCGMEKTAEPNSAAYLASWCKGLTRDKAQAFLTALDEAEKAVKMILGKDDQAEDEKPTEAASTREKSAPAKTTAPKKETAVDRVCRELEDWHKFMARHGRSLKFRLEEDGGACHYSITLDDMGIADCAAEEDFESAIENALQILGCVKLAPEPPPSAPAPEQETAGDLFAWQPAFAAI